MTSTTPAERQAIRDTLADQLRTLRDRHGNASARFWVSAHRSIYGTSYAGEGRARNRGLYGPAYAA